MLSLVIMALGVLLLLTLPAFLLVLAFGHPQNTHLPGTFVILSSVGGMALIAIGAALRD